MRRVLLVLAGAAALGAVAILARPRAPGVPTLEVKRARFVHRVRAEGNLKEKESTALGVPNDVDQPFKIGWLIDDGSQVKAGDLVVKFDPTELERLIENGRVELRSTDRRIEKGRVESAARIGNLDRDSRMAGIELDSARRFEKKDRDIYSKSQIIEAEIDEDLAREKEAHARAVRLTQESLARTEEDLLDIERKKSRIKVEQAETALRSVVLTAPHEGFVLIQRNWRGEPMRVGDRAFAGMPVARIPKLDALEAEVFVLEADAGGLAVGQPVELRIEAHPELSFRGKLSRVDSLARPRQRNMPVQYFGATVELERTDPAMMRPGSRVAVAITISEQEAVVSLPHQCVMTRDGRKVVWRRRGGGFEAVPVKLGAASPARVIVEEGLSEGDRVALRDPSREAAELLGTAEGSGSGEGRPRGGMELDR